MNDKVRIGVIGTGRIGKLHINNLCSSVPGAKVEAVADIVMNDEIKQWANSMGIAKVYSNPELIMTDPEIRLPFSFARRRTHMPIS